MKRGTILAHCGPWAKHQFQRMAEGFDPAASLVIAGLSPSCDDVGLKRRLVDSIKRGAREDGKRTDPHIEEELLRCRFLRSIPRARARSYLAAMDRVWDSVLQETKPSCVVSEMVDSFVIASLERACVRQQIPFLGLVTSFVDGYFRVTRYGEHLPCRDPSDEEIVAVAQALRRKGYVPSFVCEPKSAALTVSKRWLKNWLRAAYFGALSVLPSNRADINVRGSFIVARQSLHMLPRVRLGSSGWLERARQRKLPIVVVPLQMIPEATVDYWTRNVKRIRYDEVLQEVLDLLAGRFTFVIKEHPNVLGDRNPSLYRALERRPDVIFADTWTSSPELLEHCDGVLVWTGSMGFEAAIRGKAVLALTPAYYMRGQRFMVLEDDMSPSAVEDFVVATGKRPVSEAETNELVRHLLSGLIPGKLVFRNDFDSVKEKYTDPRVIGERLRSVKDCATDTAVLANEKGEVRRDECCS